VSILTDLTPAALTAAIEDIGTLASARRRGIGSTLTLVPMLAASAAGV
jgi:ribosomal protein S18 acetylase RimI-like enzyme